MTPERASDHLIEALTLRYGPGEAKAIARIVFEDAFDRGRAFDITRFEEIRSRLVSGEPIQYVMGEADFFGLKFKVSPAVLIPRQETEELVDWVLDALKKSSFVAPKVIDIGLGSGCIGIALKKRYPTLQLFGLEKSPKALQIAQENALRILGKEIAISPLVHFMQGDILHQADWKSFPLLEVVVSNPPYIPFSEISLIPEHVLSHEPGLALFVDGPDPLLFYRVITDFALEKLIPGGALFFECNEFNAQEVETLLLDKGFESVALRKDLSGSARMVMGVRG